MTAVIAIAAIVATLAAGFGGAYYGGKLQRTANVEVLALQLQIETAARFIAAVGNFTIGYAQSNKPGAENLTPTEQDESAFLAFIALKSATAAVNIVGPDELSILADKILEKAVDAGFDHGTGGVSAHNELRDLTNDFRDAAQKLRPFVRKKNGRKPGLPGPAPSARP
jgi:hypothetical protein